MARLLLILLALLLAADGMAQSTQPLSAGPGGFRPALSFSVTVPLNQIGEGEGGLSRRALLEMGAVALTGAGHLAFSAADATGLFIPLASLGWGSYVYYRARTDPHFLRHAGLTRRGLGRTFRDASLVAAGSLALMAGVGAVQGSLVLDPDMVPLLLLYPAWGLVQHRNLWPLGLYHGWLGVFYYFWVLERNPWRYVVG